MEVLEVHRHGSRIFGGVTSPQNIRQKYYNLGRRRELYYAISCSTLCFYETYINDTSRPLCQWGVFVECINPAHARSVGSASFHRVSHEVQMLWLWQWPRFNAYLRQYTLQYVQPTYKFNPYVYVDIMSKTKKRKQAPKRGMYIPIYVCTYLILYCVHSMDPAGWHESMRIIHGALREPNWEHILYNGPAVVRSNPILAPKLRQIPPNSFRREWASMATYQWPDHERFQ
jgi:hypothetical protein